MKFDLKNLPQSEIEVLVELDPKEWGEFVDEAVKELSREAKIEGFRPGHAPRNIVEQRVGMGKILEKAADAAVKKTFVRVIIENKIETVSQPQISITKIAPDNPFEFKVRVFVVPQLKLGDYQSIAKQENNQPKKAIKLEEKEVRDALKWLQKSRTKYITINQPAKKGDRVEVDFTAKKNGQAFEGGESKNHPLVLGEGRFVPGFEDNLLGLKEGEEKKFSLVFPGDFQNKDLAGQLVDFEIKVKLVQEAQVPELNDELAKSLGAFADLAALEQNIKEGLIQEKEMHEKEMSRAGLLEKISQKSEAEIPLVLIEAELEKMLQELKGGVAQMGLEFERYLKNIKKTEAELKSEWQLKARQRVLAALVLREIARRENLEVGKPEVEAEINKILAHYPDLEAAERQIDREQLKEYAKGRLMNEKVFVLLENL